MDAKDTVMDTRCNSICPKIKGCSLLEEQAEISFKAGKEEGKYSISTIVDVENDAFKSGRKAGIREVVEWLKEQGGSIYLEGHRLIDFLPLPAKLKEWGM